MKIWMTLGCIFLLAACDNTQQPAVKPKAAGYLPIVPTGCTAALANTASEPYAVDIQIGGKAFRLIPDTGSSDLVVPSSKCADNCDSTTTYAGPLKETKSQVSYGTGAGEGALANALINLGGLKTDANFVAILSNKETNGVRLFPDEQHLCYQSKNGILGLAYAQLNSEGADSLIGTLSKSGMPDGFAFQICNQYEGLERVGHLFLGGYPSKNIKGPIQYAKLFPDGPYGIRIKSISIAGAPIKFPDKLDAPQQNGKTSAISVLDSGTTRIIMRTKKNTAALIAALKAAEPVVFFGGTSKDVGDGFYEGIQTVDDGELAPDAQPLAIELEGLGDQNIQINVPMDQIFQTQPEGTLRQTEVYGGTQTFGATLLGDTVFKGNMVIFDRTNNRIGFAKGANCTAPASRADIDVYF